MNTTKTAQFTPGPWSAYNSKNGVIYKHWRVNTGTGLILLDDAAHWEAGNATLIAAAPVMYADLCAVRDYLFELYDEGNAKAGEYAASLGITIEQAEGRHHE